MKGSLFDQLKNAGLVDKQKAKQVKKAQYQQAKQKKSQQGKKTDVEVSEAARLVAEAAEKKAARDRQLNLERQQQQAIRAAKIELSQLISSNKMTGCEGELVYQFADDKVIKKLYVNKSTRSALVAGRIRIARFEQGYVFVSEEAAEKIAQRSQEVLIPLSTAEDTVSDEDKDFYAQFAIPDDLVW